MTAMDTATWTLIGVVLAAVVAFAVEIRTSTRSLRTDLGGDITRLDNKIDTLRTDLGGDITRLDNKIDTLRTDLGGDITRLDNKIDTLRTDLGGDITRLARVQERMAGQLDVLVTMAHTHQNATVTWATPPAGDPASPPGPASAA